MRGDGSQSFPKARTPAAFQKPYYSLHLLKTALLSVMPSCQGLSVPLNESPSNSSHRTRPGPFSSSVYPQKSKARHPSARHSGYLLTKYLLLGSMDGEVGPQQKDRERERLGSAGSRALLSADDPWAAAREQGLGWYRSSSEEARPLQARARGQTPPPSQPHKCHNCQTSGSAISSAALPPHSLQNSSPTSEGTPPLSPTSQF